MDELELGIPDAFCERPEPLEAPRPSSPTPEQGKELI